MPFTKIRHMEGDREHELGWKRLYDDEFTFELVEFGMSATQLNIDI